MARLQRGTWMLAAAAMAVATMAAGVAPARARADGAAILARIPIQAGANTAVVDERTGRVFIAGTAGMTGDAGIVSVLDARSGRLVRTLTVGKYPLAAAVDGRSGHVFVAGAMTGAATGWVTMLDAASGAPLRTTSVPLAVGVGDTAYMAVDQQTGRVFVVSPGLDAGPGQVSTLDTATGALVHSEVAADDLGGAAVDERTGRLFIPTNGSEPYVSVADAGTGHVLRTIEEPAPSAPPHAVAVDESTGRVFVTNQLSDTICVLDARTGTVLSTVKLSSDPAALAVNERSGRVFVTSLSGKTVSMLDARTGALVHTVALGSSSQTVAVDTLSDRVFVVGFGDASGGDPTVAVIDGQSGTVRSRTALGIDAFTLFLAVDAQTGRLFVIDSMMGTVSILDANA